MNLDFSYFEILHLHVLKCDAIDFRNTVENRILFDATKYMGISVEILFFGNVHEYLPYSCGLKI